MKNYLLALILTLVMAGIAQSVVLAADAPFQGEYFNNPNLSGTPSLIRTDPTIDFNWGQKSPDPSINADNFSIRWTKNETFSQAGKYSFTLISDDGARLYIDNNLILDKWIERGTTHDIAETELSQGDHLIRMEYFDKMGGANAKLTWALSGNVAGVATTASVAQATPSAQPATKELPKTGTPILGWVGIALMLVGLKLINLSNVKDRLENSAKYLWEERKFKAGS